MPDVTLNLTVPRRLQYSLIQAIIFVGLVVALAACSGRLWRDMSLLLAGDHIDVVRALVSLLLVGFAVWAFVVIVPTMFRYPVLLSSQIALKGSRLEMLSKSGRVLASIENVHVEAYPRWKPRKVWFSVRPGSRDSFDIPLWLLDAPARAAILDGSRQREAEQA